MSQRVKVNLPRVYPITDREISGLSHTEQVKHLLEGGATLIQLREKRMPPIKFYSDAQKAAHLARAAGARLIINDRVDIALALRADGVHLGQTDMPVQAARRLLGDDAIIGFSTHNFEQVKAALRLPIDYLAFGPIYPTTTKVNPDPVVCLDEITQIAALSGAIPVVAIGGINQSNAVEVLRYGADAVAIISALLSNPSSISQKLRDLRSLTS